MDSRAAYATFCQHLLQFTMAYAVFSVPANSRKNDVALKTPAFK
ncbi:hypothetical protein CSC17_5942 (plasmid) [Klebsiella oxytoca]|nr:hypothetical protein CSC17_5942 [Klebsiella oxytoca]